MSVNHKLGQAEASNRIKTFLEKAPKQFSGELDALKTTWNGPTIDYSFKFANITVNGNLAITKNTIVITSKIPLALLIFRSKIEQAVKQYAEGILK